MMLLRSIAAVLFLFTLPSLAHGQEAWPLSGRLVPQEGGVFLVEGSDEGYVRAFPVTALEAWAVEGEGGWRVLDAGGAALSADTFEQVVGMARPYRGALVENGERWGVLGAEGVLEVPIEHETKQEAALALLAGRVERAEAALAAGEPEAARVALALVLGTADLVPSTDGEERARHLEHVRSLCHGYVDAFGPREFLRVLETILPLEKEGTAELYLGLLPIDLRERAEVYLASARGRLRALRDLNRVWPEGTAPGMVASEPEILEALIAYCTAVEATLEPFDAGARSRADALILQQLERFARTQGAEGLYRFLLVVDGDHVLAYKALLPEAQQEAVKRIARGVVEEMDRGTRENVFVQLQNDSGRRRAVAAECTDLSELRELPSFAGTALQSLQVGRHGAEGIVVIDATGRTHSLGFLSDRIEELAQAVQEDPTDEVSQARYRDLSAYLESLSEGAVAAEFGMSVSIRPQDLEFQSRYHALADEIAADPGGEDYVVRVEALRNEYLKRVESLRPDDYGAVMAQLHELTLRLAYHALKVRRDGGDETDEAAAMKLERAGRQDEDPRFWPVFVWDAYRTNPILCSVPRMRAALVPVQQAAQRMWDQADVARARRIRREKEEARQGLIAEQEAERERQQQRLEELNAELAESQTGWGSNYYEPYDSSYTPIGTYSENSRWAQENSWSDFRRSMIQNDYAFQNRLRDW
ncbi:MAG TPA: hypothetical protein ENJ09_01120 [Planctomycetes bacterium]|nr:hypothetical protein [Planctomycetota bacterium]